MRSAFHFMRRGSSGCISGSSKRCSRSLIFQISAPVSALIVLSGIFFQASALVCLAKDSIPNRLFDGQNVPTELNKKIAQQLNYPPAPTPGKDNVVPPPGENQYFPIRSDGQPYFVALDKTINITEALNRFYYDPKWRGERWVPEDPITLPEKVTRIMATWPEYDQENIYRVGNGMARFFEKYTGFGP